VSYLFICHDKKQDRPSYKIRYGGLYLYFNSRSFRLAAKSLAEVKKRSHVAIWKWVQRYADCADKYRTDRRLVSVIFVDDETLLQIDGRDYWLWIAYEPAIDSCLMMMHLSLVRGRYSCVLSFLQAVARQVYGRKPIFTDIELDGTMMRLGG
jgi:transposase-like protein